MKNVEQITKGEGYTAINMGEYRNPLRGARGSSFRTKRPVSASLLWGLHLQLFHHRWPACIDLSKIPEFQDKLSEK